MPLKTGPKARAIIQKWEGLPDGDPSTANLDPYLCPANYATIGWGHVVIGSKGQMLKGRRGLDEARSLYPNGITREEAEQLLAADLIHYERYVYPVCDEQTTPGQFGAMVSLCFNIGPANFAKSSVAKYHRAHEYYRAADSFLLWNKARIRGVLTPLRGLTNRRRDERQLYLDHLPK